MKFALIAVGVASLAQVGCEKPAPPPVTTAKPAPQTGGFSAIASSDGTFLIDQASGKIWKFSAKDGAFLEVPVTSSIKYYNPATGKLEDKDPRTGQSTQQVGAITIQRDANGRIVGIQ